VTSLVNTRQIPRPKQASSSALTPLLFVGLNWIVAAIVHPQCMDIYLVNMGRQEILCLLAVKNGMGVAT